MKIIVFIVLAVLITYVGICIHIGCKMVYKAGHPPRIKQSSLFQIAYEYSRFTFQTFDNLTLSGVKYMPKQMPKGTILVFHYLGGTSISIYSYIETLLLNGFIVASFDYVNHGESMNRKRSTYLHEKDLEYFIRTIKEMNFPEPYGTMGFSMGASLALSARDYLPEVKATVIDSGPLIYTKDYFRFVLNNKKVKNIIVRYAFTFIFVYLEGFLKMSRRMKYRMENCTGLHLLMIHCKKDNTISYKNARYVYEMVKSQDVKLVTALKGHHLTNRVFLGDMYDEMVTDFFLSRMLNKENY